VVLNGRCPDLFGKVWHRRSGKPRIFVPSYVD
jgi:hypothetical protein